MGPENELIVAANELFKSIGELPTSETATALKAQAARLEKALRHSGYELGRESWQKPLP